MQYRLTQEELPTLVAAFLKEFESGVVILRGDLAAGKTTLVQEFVKYLGVDEEATSPTFSLQHIYGEKIYHYDLYNKGLEHFLSLGMLEEFEKEGLHFVEWGDTRLEQLLRDAGIAVATIAIDKISHTQREYKICIH